jgi:adenylate kinase family enzyme
MQGDSHAQARIREHHGAGKLQPKFLSVSLWGPELLNSVTGEEHVVIDGIPRHGLEAELLDSFFEFYDREPVHVVHIQVPEGVASERLRARCEAQDDPQAIANRLAWYQTDTHPLLDFFEQSPRYRVITVDATKDREAILAEIAAQLRTA